MLVAVPNRNQHRIFGRRLVVTNQYVECVHHILITDGNDVAIYIPIYRSIAPTIIEMTQNHISSGLKVKLQYSIKTINLCPLMVRFHGLEAMHRRYVQAVNQNIFMRDELVVPTDDQHPTSDNHIHRQNCLHISRLIRPHSLYLTECQSL